MIDVSVGLFDGGGDGCGRGARVEDWFEWGKDRVSFAECIREGRTGGIADWAERLLKGLEEGMKGSFKKDEKGNNDKERADVKTVEVDIEG